MRKADNSTRCAGCSRSNNAFSSVSQLVAPDFLHQRRAESNSSEVLPSVNVLRENSTAPLGGRGFLFRNRVPPNCRRQTDNRDSQKPLDSVRDRQSSDKERRRILEWFERLEQLDSRRKAIFHVERETSIHDRRQSRIYRPIFTQDRRRGFSRTNSRKRAQVGAMWGA